jgi:hypothetical protein
MLCSNIKIKNGMVQPDGGETDSIPMANGKREAHILGLSFPGQ